MSAVKWFVLAIIGMELLTGCFDAESPCHYFELVETNLRNNQWNVDTLQLFVFDSTTLYSFDTTYVNYATVRFNPYTTDNCTDTGIMTLTLPSGKSVTLIYYADGYGYPAYNISLYSTNSLDGYTLPFSGNGYMYTTTNKTYIDAGVPYNFYDSIYYNRFWGFTLSKK